GRQGHAGVGESRTEEDRQVVRLGHEAGRSYTLSELDEVVGAVDGGTQLAECGASPVQERAAFSPGESRAAGGEQRGTAHAGCLLRSINRSAGGLWTNASRALAAAPIIPAWRPKLARRTAISRL